MHNGSDYVKCERDTHSDKHRELSLYLAVLSSTVYFSIFQLVVLVLQPAFLMFWSSLINLDFSCSRQRFSLKKV